jgi:diguanylate cyclase (GGDEF)-like protein
MEKPFVLIIEDERDIAALFRHVMDLAGYRTEICSNGTLALERLTNSSPDVVLLDLSLPGISGGNLLQRMRVDERLRGIPVVVITAYSELAENMAVEPDLVMLKPVSAVQLTDLVRRLTRDNKKGHTTPFGVQPFDELTGLYNRAFFLHRLDSAITSLQQDGQSLFAVLAISPDRYELINHQHGKRQAEQFLHSFGEALRGCVRPTDTVARFDGDHFFILIEHAPGLQIPDLIASRIQQRLQALPPGPADSRLVPHIGVLLCDGRYGNVDEIVRDARVAYELARAAGPGSSLTFDRDSIQAAGGPA